jgi:hypothetical protein
MKLFKTTLILITIFSMSIVALQAQTFDSSDTEGILNTPVFNKYDPAFSPNKMSFKMELGVGFIGGSNSGMYTYLAPYLRYPVTKKFSLDVGGIISQGSGNFYPEQNGSSSITSGLLFARGNYLLTDKITVSGSIYKMIYPTTYNSTDPNHRYSSQNYSYSLGMNYKITKNLSFGAQVIVNKGINNNQLFQTQPSLFGSSPFQSNQTGMFGW